MGNGFGFIRRGMQATMTGYSRVYGTPAIRGAVTTK